MFGILMVLVLLPFLAIFVSGVVAFALCMHRCGSRNSFFQYGSGFSDNGNWRNSDGSGIFVLHFYRLVEFRSFTMDSEGSNRFFA